jgi:hypothetical protein
MVSDIRRKKVEVLALRQSPDTTDNPYDIILLQDTSLKAKQSIAGILGKEFTVYHDPSPQFVGRGVAIAVNRKLGLSLTNITYGSNIDKIAAGRLITGDITFATKDGDIKTIELTSFYVPCDAKAKQPFLEILGPYLRGRSNRDGVTCIAGGDGNGIWETNERIHYDGSPNNDNSEEACAFRTCMEGTGLHNQKPPGSFDPETQPTHEHEKGKSRIDYIFMNTKLEKYVRHTERLEQKCVPTESTEKKIISAHYWIEATIPLEELGGIVRPIQRIHIHPHRIKVDLADPKARTGAVDLIHPILENWLLALPPQIREAYIENGTLAESSATNKWQACSHTLRKMLEQVTHLTVQAVQDALGQPDPARIRKQPRPGRPCKKTSWAPEAGPHAQMEFWYNKALIITEAVIFNNKKAHSHPHDWWGLGNITTTKMVANLLEFCKVADKWQEILPQHPGIALNNTDQAAGSETTYQTTQGKPYRPTLATLRTVPTPQLKLYASELRKRMVICHAKCEAAQIKANKAADDIIQEAITTGLFRAATKNARKLLYPQPIQIGVHMLRHPITAKVTTKPSEVTDIATEYTRNLLGKTTPTPPTDRPWQDPSEWTQLTDRWSDEETKNAQALATVNDLRRLIAAGKASSAPGLDGVQYLALKLLLQADTAGDHEGELHTLLTNLLNTTIKETTLPTQLGTSEIVYFYKKGDPTNLANYRGLALQNVLYKLPAAFIAGQLLGAAGRMQLLSEQQLAARKNGRAADHVAVMAAAIAEATASGRELHIITCDIQKAFDDVPRHALWEAMERHGYPPETIRRVSMLQTCSGASVRTQYGRSKDPVLTTMGCKQGCPLSPITYCLFMNMLHRQLDKHPGGYQPTPPPGHTNRKPCNPLKYQAYMDDLALFAENAREAQAMIGIADRFLAAYTMRFNAKKCYHTSILPKLPEHWGPKPPVQTDSDDQGNPTQKACICLPSRVVNAHHIEVPQTPSDKTFEYLGYLLPTNGNWQAQERKLRIKLAQAMGKVHIASDKRACHTLWVAKLSQHDAASLLPYYMGASDLSEAFLRATLTAIVEPTRIRCTLGTHVARERLCGPPERGGLGIIDPRAQNAGEKVTTMLRLLNSPEESATHALAAHALSVVQNGPTKQTKKNIMPTARGAVKGLAEAPQGETKWEFFENYACLQVTTMGELAPTLLRPGTGQSPLVSAAALAAMSAGTVLRLAQPRNADSAPTTGDTDRELGIISPAEEDILRTGGTNVRDTLSRLQNTLPPEADIPAMVTAARTLFTEEYFQLFMKLDKKRRSNILRLILPALTTSLCGPMAYKFVTRHTTLIHALKHRPPTTEQPRLCTTHVGVDGSFIQPGTNGPARAAGAACFYVLAPNHSATELPEAHILTCTFPGDQTVVNAECNAVTLALQALNHEHQLDIGWDHDTGVKRLDWHKRQPDPNPLPYGLREPTSYDANPHFYRLLTLKQRDEAEGRLREATYTKAHTESDDEVARILATQGAVRIDTASGARVVSAEALQKVTLLYTPRPIRRGQTNTPPHRHPAAVIKLVQNALSDWGSKAVAVRCEPATVRLTTNTLTAHRWAIADQATGTLITSDQRAARRAVIDRVMRNRLEMRDPIKHAPGAGRMDNVETVWQEESTAALRLPRDWGRRLPEKYTKHMTTLNLGSHRHNTEWAADHPEMATTTITIDGKSETMSLTCPICKAPGPSDTKHHLYHECTATKGHRDDLHGALCAKLAPRLGGTLSNTLATRMIERPNYYAGQVGQSIKDELKKDSAGEHPKPGDLHRTLLHHSLEMRNLRTTAIETSAAATKDKISVHDAHAFKIAWWAAQAAERAAKKKSQADTPTPAGKKQQRQHRGGQQDTAPAAPPPPARTMPHYPIPTIRLESIRGEPRKRERTATQQPPAPSPAATIRHATPDANTTHNPTPTTRPAATIRDEPHKQQPATQPDPSASSNEPASHA